MTTGTKCFLRSATRSGDQFDLARVAVPTPQVSPSGLPLAAQMKSGFPSAAALLRPSQRLVVHSISSQRASPGEALTSAKFSAKESGGVRPGSCAASSRIAAVHFIGMLSSLLSYTGSPESSCPDETYCPSGLEGSTSFPGTVGRGGPADVWRDRLRPGSREDSPLPERRPSGLPGRPPGFRSGAPRRPSSRLLAFLVLIGI